MPELKPCPFCGSQDVAKVIEGARHPMIYVRCNGCLSMSGWYEADEENMMLSAWNKRAGEGQVNRMDRLDKAIADVAYILDVLMAYRNIIQTGDCNTCVGKCGDYKPKPGQMVRYNCPHYFAREEKQE